MAEVSYESTDPTVDAQIIQLRASNADAVFIIARASRHAGDPRPSSLETADLPAGGLGSSVPAVLKPAGAEAATGVIAAANAKSGRPSWTTIRLRATCWAKEWAPSSTPTFLRRSGYLYGTIIADLLRRCGDELTRET